MGTWFFIALPFAALIGVGGGLWMKRRGWGGTGQPGYYDASGNYIPSSRSSDSGGSSLGDAAGGGADSGGGGGDSSS